MSHQYNAVKRALVNGGAGFLGSHLRDRQIERGHDAWCLDNFFTGAKRNVCASWLQRWRRMTAFARCSPVS